MRDKRTVTGLVVALIVAGAVWWTQNGGGLPGGDEPSSPGPSASSSPSQSPSSSSPSSAPESPGGDGQSGTQTGTDPDSGLPMVALDDLPPEAAETVDLIDAGGPFPEDEDGSTFGNREGLLPDEPYGYYREYTVPTPGSDDRGARRIVGGSRGELYWTADHYESFERIQR